MLRGDAKPRHRGKARTMAAPIPNTYSICGHPAWSDAACHECDGCRDGRRRWQGVESAAQNAVAFWDNDRSMIEAAMDELRAALDRRQVRQS